jgi:glycosyltransferase involved in cell wall biosynthesis
MENKDIRDKMGLTARKRIMENYSWSNSAKIFIDILKKEGII